MGLRVPLEYFEVWIPGPGPTHIILGPGSHFRVQGPRSLVSPEALGHTFPACLELGNMKKRNETVEM